MKLIRLIVRQSAAGLVACFFVAGSVSAADAAPVAPAAAPAPVQHSENTVYATVNGQPILISDYATAFNATLRQKFYHGQVPEGEFAKVRDLVTKQLVLRILLLDEAKRRGIGADEKKLADEIAMYETKYATSEAWKQSREQVLPGLRAEIAKKSILEQLEKAVRDLPVLSGEDVRKFYDSHLELFTEPEKLHLSVIMLTVNPSSPETAWEAARAEAQAIYNRLVGGADFAEAARMHSTGKEAAQGGDLGYVHRGMLPDALEAKIDAIKEGTVAEPIQLLEGLAIFRVVARQLPKLRTFEDVTERATGLARRHAQDAAWADLQARLEAGATVRILGNHLLPGGGGAPK